MAVANTKSTIVTNADATPPVPTDARICNGHVLQQAGYVEVLAADDDNSVYRFHRLPSNARIASVKVMNDVITGGTDFNIGIFQTAENGGAAVDDNLIADALDLSSARNFPTEIYTAVAEENREKQLWELLGLSSDPKRMYDLAAIGITVGSAAGTIFCEVQFAQ